MAPAAQALANYFAGAIQAGAQGAPGAAAPTPHVTIGACGRVTQHCPTFNCSLHCATTPCINAHTNTCFCPVTHGCATQNQLCQSQGACTYVGCEASLACTQGLLCGGVAADAAPQGAQAAQAIQATLVAAACLPQTPFCPTRVGCTPPPTPFCPTHLVGCTRPPQCFVETAASHCATCFINCTVGCTQPPHCFVLKTWPPCVQISVPQILCGVGPGPVQPGTPVEQRQAFSLANCSMAFCTQVPVVCQHTQVTPCAM